MLDLAIAQAREKVNLTKFFRRNACVRHGIPWDESDGGMDARVTVEHEHTHKHESVPSPPESSQTSPAPLTSQPSEPSKAVELFEAAKEVSEDKNRKIWPWLLAAMLAAAPIGGVTGYFLSQSGGDEPAPVVKPAEKTDVTGSLLQYLEDHGRNWPGHK